MAHMSIPCHEGPPATAGHLCSEPAVAGGGRYYCTMNINELVTNVLNVYRVIHLI